MKNVIYLIALLVFSVNSYAQHTITLSGIDEDGRKRNIRANDTVSIDGFIGLGTASPIQKLHLSDTATIQIIIDADSDNAGEAGIPAILFRQDGQVCVLQIGGEGNSGQTFKNSIANSPYFEAVTSNGSLQFATNDTLRMTVNDFGKLILNSYGAGILKTDASGNVTANAEQAWQIPTLLNSWSNFGSGWATAQYYKTTNDMVVIKGTVKSGIISSTSSTGNIFVLPAGYRPLENISFPVIANNGSSDILGRVVVYSTGDVRAYMGSNTYFILDPIIFKAEQ